MARTAMSLVFIGLLALAPVVLADPQTATPSEPQAPPEAAAVEPRTDLTTIDEAIEAIGQADGPIEAIGAFEAGRRIDANSTALYEAYIRTMAEWGQFDLAYRPAQELVDLDPENALGWAVMAQHAAQENSPSLAVWAVSKAAEHHDDEPFVLETIARVAAWYRWQRDQQGGNASVDGQVDALVHELATNDVFSEAYSDATSFYEDLDQMPDTATAEPSDQAQQAARQATGQTAQEAVERHYHYYYYAPSSGFYGGVYPYFYGYSYTSPRIESVPYYGRIYINFGYFHSFGHGYDYYYPYRRHVYPRYYHHRFYHHPQFRDRRDPYRHRFPHEREPIPKRGEEIRERLQRRYDLRPRSFRGDHDRDPRVIRRVDPFGKRLTTRRLTVPKHDQGNKVEVLRQVRRPQPIGRLARPKPGAGTVMRKEIRIPRTLRPAPVPDTQGRLARPDTTRRRPEAPTRRQAVPRRTAPPRPANKLEALRQRRR